MKALKAIQQELKAPKNQFNSFGRYSYRSCEDILEAVKPLLKKYDSAIVISDEMVSIGSFNYIKATVKFYHEDFVMENSAYARESVDKKGMDDSQITGTASSYARKYALNGMFLIDDTKDADTDEFQGSKESAKKSNQVDFKVIRRNIKEAKTLSELMEIYNEIPPKFTQYFKEDLAKRKAEL